VFYQKVVRAQPRRRRKRRVESDVVRQLLYNPFHHQANPTRDLTFLFTHFLKNIDLAPLKEKIRLKLHAMRKTFLWGLREGNDGVTNATVELAATTVQAS
jgi:hypothetical protein